jgi:hypothetical protein
MSRPSEPDGFDDRTGEGAGWQEPAHLGEGAGAAPRQEPAAWEPPGWSLPEAQEAVPDAHESVPGGQAPGPPAGAPAPWHDVPDPFGMRTWARQQGWEVSDGEGPRDAGLPELLSSAPVRLTSDYRPLNVVRGRYGQLEVVAFDVVFPLGKRLEFEYAVTAAPLLGDVPRLRLSPARFWKHGVGGLLRIPSGDSEFDQRWVLLAAEDGPQVRRLAEDPAVRGLLLGSDDGDEFWTAAGHVAAIRKDAHRPVLLDHHGRLLTAVVAALAPSL